MRIGVTPFTGEGHTVNYGWVKPAVGDSVDAWGDMINADLDSIDTIVHGIQTAAPSILMEQVTVTGTNTLANLSQTPNTAMFVLYVDGRPFFPVGTSPDLSLSGATITWLNPLFDILPSSTVIAVYTWSA
jgi:hypothetical protein